MFSQLNEDNLSKLGELRDELFAALERSIARGDGGKVYEGTFEIVLPSYFHERNIRTFSFQGDFNELCWCVKLHCYLIGPGRHYEWAAPTLAEAIAKAAKDVRGWIAEDENENAP